MELQKGQKLKLNDLTSETQLTITVSATMKSGDADITCFGVDEAGKLSDDRYFIFYNQTTSPEGALTMKKEPQSTIFGVDLSRLPNTIQKLVVTVATDGGLMRDMRPSQIVLAGGGASASYSFDGTAFQDEKALILCELYRKDGIWRYTVIASGFNGGLSALLAHFGGEESSSKPKPAPTPAPSPPPAKINLSKISLQKAGDLHKIDLSKNGGEIHVNLNWNHGQKTLFGGNKKIDLDLACMYRLKDGTRGVIQALGNSFGSGNAPPYILLDQDDRTGTSTNGENMFFKKPELLDFAVVFAYIYEGVPNWRGTDATVVLHQKGAPDIEIKIDNPNSNDRFCVLASLSGTGSGLDVKREDRFFQGHKDVDAHYHFGFRWVAGQK